MKTIFILCLFASTALAQRIEFPERAALDALLVGVVDDLSVAQTNYLSMRGRYWQGLPTHDTLPKDGDIETRVDRKPSDVAEGWDDVLSLPTRIPCALQVTYYDGPFGRGYVLDAAMQSRGTNFSRTINVGPESYREHDWSVITTNEVVTLR